MMSVRNNSYLFLLDCLYKILGFLLHQNATHFQEEEDLHKSSGLTCIITAVKKLKKKPKKQYSAGKSSIILEFVTKKNEVNRSHEPVCNSC